MKIRLRGLINKILRCKSCGGSGRQEFYEVLYCYECGGSGLDKFRATIKKKVGNIKTRWMLFSNRY